MEKKQSTKKNEQNFLRQITEKAPSNVPDKIDTRPECSYEIDHVYGFASGMDRNKASLYFGKDNNEIVFSSAALGIVQDLKTRK